MLRIVYVYQILEDNDKPTFIHSITGVFPYISNEFILECHHVTNGYLTIEFGDYIVSDVPLEDIPMNEHSITIPYLLRNVGDQSYRYEV